MAKRYGACLHRNAFSVIATQVVMLTIGEFSRRQLISLLFVRILREEPSTNQRLPSPTLRKRLS